MKGIAVILLLAAFAAQSFSRAFIVLDYMANTGVYAKNCENKTRPALKCKGKCQMAKKIGEEEERNEKNPDRKAENKTEIFSVSSYVKPPERSETTLHSKGGNYINSLFSQEIIRDIFHPPLVYQFTP